MKRFFIASKLFVKCIELILLRYIPKYFQIFITEFDEWNILAGKSMRNQIDFTRELFDPIKTLFYLTDGVTILKVVLFSQIKTNEFICTWHPIPEVYQTSSSVLP